MQKITGNLETIAVAVDKGSDLLKVEEAIKVTRSLIKDFVAKTNGQPVVAIHASPVGRHELPLLKELDTELSIWQSKLAVILKEPIGKKGMAKHARFWAEKLRAIHV